MTRHMIPIAATLPDMHVKKKFYVVQKFALKNSIFKSTDLHHPPIDYWLGSMPMRCIV